MSRRWRSEPEVGPEGSWGMFAGGGGGSWHSSRSSTHFPRLTVELRVGVEFSVRMPAWVSRPRRLLPAGSVTRVKRLASKLPCRP